MGSAFRFPQKASSAPTSEPQTFSSHPFIHYDNPKDSSLLSFRYLPLSLLLLAPKDAQFPLTSSPFRPQKHHRRRPPQLPDLPPLYPIALVNRRPPCPRLCRCIHRRGNFLRRLQARMGRYQDGYAGGCDSVFHYQRRIDGVDLGSGEG